MIFPDKPRPPWQAAQPKRLLPKQPAAEPVVASTQPRPPGYWRERIEFTIIVVGFYFWVQFWWQYQ
jgi:hypothetical protein